MTNRVRYVILLALIVFAVLARAASAAYPTLWANWVVANAAAVPSPAPTGYYGPVVVAQATAAPTTQPGNVAVTSIKAGSATVTGALTANSAAVSGAVSAASATLTGALNAASATISGTATVGGLNLPSGTGVINTPAVNYINTNNKLSIFADSGGQNYIESGNNGFTGNVPLNITGYFGNQGSTLNLNFASVVSSGYYQGGSSIGDYGFRMPSANSSGYVGLVASSSSGSVSGIFPSTIGFCNYQVACEVAVDTSGNMGVAGNVYATNFFTGSRREWKRDITPYTFDALDLLDHVDFKEYVCKDPRCGAIGSHHIGIIANDTPWEIAGKKHDHYDAFAMAAIDGKAITELQKRVAARAPSAQIDALTQQVRVLEGFVAVLLVWCGLLTFGALRRA